MIQKLRDMMFVVRESKLGFDETVAAITENAPKHGWTIPMVHDLQDSYQKAGHEDMTRLKTIYLCDPDGGYSILQDDDNKPMSVMMPTGVSVYETSDGRVYVAGMNLGMMSMMFGGGVKEVLKGGAAKFDKTVEDITEAEEECEAKVDKKGCCLGCISCGAIAAAVLGTLVVIVAKVISVVMPKMMSVMMPKMMEFMDKADVEPPCAMIIKDYLEAKDS